MHEAEDGLLNSRSSSAGLDRRSRGYHAGFGGSQGGNPTHSRVDAIQPVTMESHCENVFKIEHYHTIKGIERHADKESPLLALAGEIPEDDEHASHEAVDDQIKGEPALPGLMRQCVYKFSDPQTKDEANASAAHREHRIDH